VKSVSDEFDFVFPATEQFVDSAGNFQQRRFAAYAALRPWLWPKVRTLAVNSNLASRALCDWLAGALTGIAESGPEQKLEAIHRQ